MSLMLARCVSLLGLGLLASCGANGQSSHRNQGGAAVDNPALARLGLTSDAFGNGQPIPVQYTCDGTGERPTLRWDEPPQGTRSFALVIDDPDAPSGTFRHWGIFDIPASARSIGAKQKVGHEAKNDFGKPGYGGPCPPRGHGPHHYHFKLFALSVDELSLSPDARAAEVEDEARKHALGEGELIGTYERK